MRAYCLCLMAVLGLTACGSTPPEQFYALTVPGNLRVAPASAGYFALVLPVQLPEALDRPQLVIYRGDNRVDVLEQSRWAGSLKSEVKQALVNTLARRGISNIDGVPVPQGRKIYRVLLTVNTLAVSAAQSSQWQASWTLRSTDGKLGSVCHTAGSGPAAGSDGAGAAKAYRAAVAALTERVAESLSQLALGGVYTGCNIL